MLPKIDKTDNFGDIRHFYLIIKTLIVIVANSNKQEAELQVILVNHQSLQQKVWKLDEKILNLLWERDKAVELTTKIRAENTILEHKNKELEANRKALIEELGGAVGREDLEYATWDLVLQTTQLLIKERDKAVEENQSLKQENSQLVQSINRLESQINSKENEINFVKQKLSDTDREVSALQARYTSLKHLQNELGQKESDIQAINRLESQISSKENEINFVKQKLSDTEREVSVLQAKYTSSLKHLQNEIAQKESDIQALKEENSENQKIITSLKDNLYNEQSYKSEKQQNIEDNSKDRYKFIQNLLIEKEQLYSSDIYIDLHKKNFSSAIKEYNNLIYFIQISFPDFGIEEINEWRQTESFYFHIISQLYVINSLLVCKVRELDKKTGKALYWCNQVLVSELNILLSQASFLDSQDFNISYFA
ncbi:hypothetical protein [Brasilonema sennae]|uniref:hypothetical protein n=1 Tax=Brasilonema sennae TaxID=1397703 RepID=UPI00155AED96|nr:hypothetical protein [Brasilonema sennae]